MCLGRASTSPRRPRGTFSGGWVLVCVVRGTEALGGALGAALLQGRVTWGLFRCVVAWAGPQCHLSAYRDLFQVKAVTGSQGEFFLWVRQPPACVRMTASQGHTGPHVGGCWGRSSTSPQRPGETSSGGWSLVCGGNRRSGSHKGAASSDGCWGRAYGGVLQVCGCRFRGNFCRSC